jgi:hypothetical protein
MSASVKPIVKTIINKNKTYFGALEVIAKILLGSKDLNIFKLYILKKDILIFIMESRPDQECRGSQ